MGVTIKSNKRISSLKSGKEKGLSQKIKEGSAKIFKIKLDNKKKALTFATP
jgi:hypothetical protein